MCTVITLVYSCGHRKTVARDPCRRSDYYLGRWLVSCKDIASLEYDAARRFCEKCRLDGDGDGEDGVLVWSEGGNTEDSEWVLVDE